MTYHIPNYACIGAFFVNKVPSAAIAHRPAREMAILVDPPRAKALGDQLRINPLDFAIFAVWRVSKPSGVVCLDSRAIWRDY